MRANNRAKRERQAVAELQNKPHFIASDRPHYPVRRQNEVLQRAADELVELVAQRTPLLSVSG